MISIVIPTYNEAATIADRLGKLKKGLTLPSEIIVTDDKSTDGTADIAKRNADIVLVADTKHKSIAANRNTGARSSKGDVLVFMDADCIMEDPDGFLSQALLDLHDRPNTVAVTSMIKVFKEQETASDRLVYFMINGVHRIKNNVLHIGEAQGKFQMMRKSDFEKVGGFNEALITREDADMFQRLAKIGKTYCDPSLVIYHSGRRAHKIGWPRLLSIWMFETFWVAISGKAKSKEWKAIR
jgi:glycosyltransferase involved in cell wall biosynthesis